MSERDRQGEGTNACDPQAGDALASTAKRLAAERVAPAISIAASVQRGGAWARVAAMAGSLSFEPEAPRVQSDTLFDLASVTKPVTALAVARLVRAGVVGYAARLGELLPELAATPSAHATVELLLAHRAGLDGHRPLYAPLVSGAPVDRRGALFEAASAVRPECGIASPPEGHPPVYSDLGYWLLGEALVRRTGCALDDLVRELVTEPLGLDQGLGSIRQMAARDPGFLRRTTPTEIVAWRGGVIRGAVHDENAWALSGTGLSGHAGLFGTASQVVRLGERLIEMLAGERDDFLSARELEPLVRRRPGATLRAGFDGKSPTGSSTGERWGAESIGHLGFTGTSLWIDPERGLAGALLTNRVHPSRQSELIRTARPKAYDAIAAWADAERRSAGS